MKRITIKQIMEWGPCYNDREIEQFFKQAGFKKSATPLQIAESSHEKKGDILWILLRPDVIPEIELHKLSVKFAESALKAERKAGREPHQDSWNAIKVKKRWIAGKATDVELAAAESAAWSAARSSAESAARSSAWSAARSAWSAAESAARSAWSAAESAAWSAAWSARSAAWSAAWPAESAQLKEVVKFLKKIENNNS